MAKKKKAARKAAPKTVSKSSASAARRRATDPAKGMNAVLRLATHPENVVATLNAHAVLLEMLIANIHVLAVGSPGVQAMRAAKDTARRLMSLRVTESLQRPAGRSKGEYEDSLELAKIELRDIMSGVIDRLGRQARGIL
jgi:hypothetical protein